MANQVLRDVLQDLQRELVDYERNNSDWLRRKAFGVVAPEKTYIENIETSASKKLVIEV